MTDTAAQGNGQGLQDCFLYRAHGLHVAEAGQQDQRIDMQRACMLACLPYLYTFVQLLLRWIVDLVGRLGAVVRIRMILSSLAAMDLPLPQATIRITRKLRADQNHSQGGFFYYMYNEVAFLALGKLDPVQLG